MLQKVMTYCLAVGAALWIAVISTGVTIEHHCAHCCQEHEAHHEAACDHCEECWTICLQVSQYDLAQDWQVPAPEITQLLKTGYEALIISNLQEIQVSETTLLPRLVPWRDIPAIVGRTVLLHSHKLSL